MSKMGKSNPKIAFLLLAAGASSRMGQPKQLLPWKDSTLLEHSIAQVKNIDSLDVFVVLGAHYETILNQLNLDNITHYIYTNWNQGMGNSLAFGVEKILENNKIYEAILIATIDQPLIEENEYKLLINNFIGNNCIIASIYQNNCGIPAIFPKKYFKELQLISGSKGAKKILLNHKNQCVLVNLGGKIVDIDTPKIYKALYQKLGSKK